MLIKVCGLMDNKNSELIGSLDIDMIGLNFYSQSKRFLEDNEDLVKNIPSSIQKVGVFVNASAGDILEKVEKYELDYVQLHGDESPEICDEMSQYVKVIKAFGMGNEVVDVNILVNHYFSTCELYLFDTKSPNYGGSGVQFDWSLIQNYDGETPFLLGGGIGMESVASIKAFHHPSFIGVDVNSRFETSPGIKDYNKLKIFIENIRR